MNKLVYDNKSKAVFESSRLGNHIILKGVNLEGIFRLDLEVYKQSGLESIDEKKISKLKYKGTWPKRLTEIITMEVVKTSVTLNFDKVKKPIKEKQPTTTIKKAKEPKKTKEVKIQDTMTLTDICDQLGIKPASARGKLRGTVDKPKEGWKWNNPKEIKKIIEILQGV